MLCSKYSIMLKYFLKANSFLVKVFVIFQNYLDMNYENLTILKTKETFALFYNGFNLEFVFHIQLYC